MIAVWTLTQLDKGIVPTPVVVLDSLGDLPAGREYAPLGQMWSDLLTCWEKELTDAVCDGELLKGAGR